MRERVWCMGVTHRSCCHTTSCALAPLCAGNRVEVVGFFNTLVEEDSEEMMVSGKKLGVKFPRPGLSQISQKLGLLLSYLGVQA